MNLIRNAIVFKAELPSADNLRTNLEGSLFTEPMSLDPASAGFVPVGESGDLVLEFERGYAFALRQDVKVIPSSAVKEAVSKRAAELEEIQGFKPGKMQTREIKDAVMVGLLARALVRSVTITCFYDTKNNYLIVPTTSKTLADVVIGKLIHSTGSVKTTTIHISDLTNSLTVRLKDWLTEGEDSFLGFEPSDTVSMKRGTETLSVKMGSLTTAQQAISEAMKAGFTVSQMGFVFGETYSFTLTSDFRLKRIDAESAPKSDEAENPIDTYKHEAAIQLYSLSTVLDTLCDLFGYKPPVEEVKEAA